MAETNALERPKQCVWKYSTHVYAEQNKKVQFVGGCMLVLTMPEIFR